jgi:hypothetical protein
MSIDTVSEVEFGKCWCCGHRVKVGYQFCFGCYRKRKKVFDDCIGAGKDDDFARQVVDRAYPLKFRP